MDKFVGFYFFHLNNILISEGFFINDSIYSGESSNNRILVAFATRSTWISYMNYCLYLLQDTWFFRSYDLQFHFFLQIVFVFFAIYHCQFWRRNETMRSQCIDGHKNIVRLHLSSADDRHRIVIWSTYCHIALIVRRWNAVQCLC